MDDDDGANNQQLRWQQPARPWQGCGWWHQWRCGEDIKDDDYKEEDEKNVNDDGESNHKIINDDDYEDHNHDDADDNNGNDDNDNTKYDDNGSNGNNNKKMSKTTMKTTKQIMNTPLILSYQKMKVCCCFGNQMGGQKLARIFDWDPRNLPTYIIY